MQISSLKTKITNVNGFRFLKSYFLFFSLQEHHQKVFIPDQVPVYLALQATLSM